MCWTGSPITWSGTSMSRHCLPRRGRRASPGPRDMHREPDAENYAGQEQAGAGIETQGARNIGSARQWRAGTNPRTVDVILCIITLPLASQAARAGPRSLPPSGHRRDDAVAEIFGEAFDRGSRDTMRIEPQRVAPDDMPDRLAPGRQAAPFERDGNNRDMFIEPALRQEDADNECLDERAEYTAAAQPLDPGADRRRHADQHDDRDNAALAPTP